MLDKVFFRIEITLDKDISIEYNAEYAGIGQDIGDFWIRHKLKEKFCIR